MHELEEAEIERQLLLRDAPVWAQPGAQQGPETLDRVDVDLAEAVAVLVARVLALCVTDRLVPIVNADSGFPKSAERKFLTPAGTRGRMRGNET